MSEGRGGDWLLTVMFRSLPLCLMTEEKGRHGFTIREISFLYVHFKIPAI